MAQGCCWLLTWREGRGLGSWRGGEEGLSSDVTVGNLGVAVTASSSHQPEYRAQYITVQSTISIILTNWGHKHTSTKRARTRAAQEVI